MPVVKVAKKKVTLSNLDKVLYPSGFTKTWSPAGRHAS